MLVTVDAACKTIEVTTCVEAGRVIVWAGSCEVKVRSSVLTIVWPEMERAVAVWTTVEVTSVCQLRTSHGEKIRLTSSKLSGRRKDRCTACYGNSGQRGEDIAREEKITRVALQ